MIQNIPTNKIQSSAMSLPHLLIFTADTPSPKLPSTFLPSILPPRAFATHLITSFPDATQLLATQSPALLILECEGGDDGARKVSKDLIRRVRYGTGAAGKRPFIVLWSGRANSDARERWYWTSQGVNMVCFEISAITKIVDAVLYLSNVPKRSEEVFQCSYCAAEMDISRMHIHVPLFHSQESEGTVCTICEVAKYLMQTTTACLTQHLKDSHPVPTISIPTSFPSYLTKNNSLKTSSPSQPKNRIPVFVLVVCKRPLDNRYLLVDELYSQGWYLPGGRVETDEDLVDAAIRETLWETGIEIQVKGILRTEFTPSKHGFRLRVIFYAEPKSSSQPAKSVPDEKSSGSCWCTVPQLDQRTLEGVKGFSNISLPMRGTEAVEWVQYVEQGGAIWPLNSLAKEKDGIVFIEDPWLESEQTPAAAKADLRKDSAKKVERFTTAGASNLELYDGGDTAAGRSEEDANEEEESEPFDFGNQSEGTTVQVVVRDAANGAEDTDHFDWVNNAPKRPLKRETFQRMKSDGSGIITINANAKQRSNRR